MFLSSANIVREKEIGTIEQLNVTTIKKYEFILGKLIPFWLLGLFELTIGLVIAWLVFGVPFEGSVVMIYLFAFIYLIAVLGLGMLISTITDRQQQAMFISWFFLVIFILMSGLFTPIESMPDWAQAITTVDPIAYFVEFIRMVLLKGSSFADVQHLFVGISIYAVATNTLAMLNYRKTSA
jgi:ABC-2 type transport system permease protein